MTNSNGLPTPLTTQVVEQIGTLRIRFEAYMTDLEGEVSPAGRLLLVDLSLAGLRAQESDNARRKAIAYLNTGRISNWHARLDRELDQRRADLQAQRRAILDELDGGDDAST